MKQFRKDWNIHSFLTRHNINEKVFAWTVIASFALLAFCIPAFIYFFFHSNELSKRIDVITKKEIRLEQPTIKQRQQAVLRAIKELDPIAREDLLQAVLQAPNAKRLIQEILSGKSGRQGAKGDTGVTGATGATGSQGIPGNNGTNGATGATGSRGLQGPQGPPGPPGPPGPRGPAGPPGTTLPSVPPTPSICNRIRIC